MKVLVISANSLPSAPSGPAYIAGAALAAGHTVETFEALFAHDLEADLKQQIKSFKPDVVAVSIRLVHAYMIDESAEHGTKHLDLRGRVKQIVDCVRENSDAHIVLGGPGFNYYGLDWLEYLNLDYGIRGEAELSFPQYLDALQERGDIYRVPGCVYRENGHFVKVPREYIEDMDAAAYPAYQLFDLKLYAEHGISPAIVN